MTDFDTLVFDQLEAFTPEPDGRADWQDVVGRARNRRARRVVVAVAAALAVLGSGAAVTAALGGFDNWLAGKPGKPAPEAAQQRFEAANARSLAAFPKGTRLRELIRAEVDGKEYVLFGFRSGGTLCLRLKAVSLGHSTGPACAPARALVAARAPILVVQDDYTFSDRHARPTAEVSFGIVADGVSRVDVEASDGVHRALLGGNAYLWVENEPNTGNRVRQISVVGADGSRTSMPISTWPGWFGLDELPARSPRGPTQLQARIPHPTVGWYFRGEPRGFPLSRLNLPGTISAGFARGVKPDPRGDTVVGLTGNLCLVVVHHGQGPSQACSPGRDVWARSPLFIVLTGASDRFYALSGVAADGIRRVVVFLANGQREKAALRDNLFTTLVERSELPVRLVGYDRRGRVVGIQTMSLLGPRIPARARRHLRPVQRVAGPNGTTALLHVGPAVHGFRCWRVDFSTGQSPRACMQLFPTGSWIQGGVQPAGRDLFVIGEVRPPVVSVELHFADGDVITTRPVLRLLVVAIPRAHLSPKRQLAFAVAYDSKGRRVQRQGIIFKRP